MTSVINALDDEMDLTPEEQAKEKKKEKQRVDLRIEADDLRAVLRTQAGRNVLSKILQRTAPLERTAVNSGSWTYFNEGVRSVGTDLLKEILEHAPEAYFQMKDEEKER